VNQPYDPIPPAEAAKALETIKSLPLPPNGRKHSEQAAIDQIHQRSRH